MTMTPRFRAVILLCGLLLTGGAVLSSSQGSAEAMNCPPCEANACYAGCQGACIYNSFFDCIICTCPP